MEDLKPLTRCEDVWFEDGTVVLQAETTLFKVYRGMLRAQSPFFNDLFALAQPDSDQSGKYEDCPLVPMYDHAVDVYRFLKALFDHQFYANVKSISDYDVIFSVVKLAHKYQVDYLLHRSLPIFAALYPASLSMWEKREGRPQYKALTAAYDKALPIFVIHLAHTTGTDVLLPSALYECCGLSVGEIRHGIIMADGTILQLEAHDQTLVLQARETLSQRARAAMPSSSVNFQDTPDEVPILYNFPLFTLMRSWWDQVYRWRYGDVPGGWVDPLSKPHLYGCFSGPGMHEVQRMVEPRRRLAHRRARQAIWDELPSVFGLPPWTKMKRDCCSSQ